MTIVKDTIKRPGSSAPWPNAKIKVAPAAPFFLDDGTDIRDSSSGQTDSDGLVSFDLAPTPDGFFYWWNYPDGKQQAFTVPATGGPYLLKDVRTSPTPPPGWVPGAVTSVDGETGAIDLSTSYASYDFGSGVLSQGGETIPLGSGGVTFGTDANGFDTVTPAGGVTFGTDSNGFDTLVA